jgi:hypothetical protein
VGRTGEVPASESAHDGQLFKFGGTAAANDRSASVASRSKKGLLAAPGLCCDSLNVVQLSQGLLREALRDHAERPVRDHALRASQHPLLPSSGLNFDVVYKQIIRLPRSAGWYGTYRRRSVRR